MKLLVILMFLFLAGPLSAQRVRVGERVPPVIARNVLNAADSTLDISRLKGKYVILDFWSTSCIVCVKSFPLVDSLQKAFEGKLQIVAVNNESFDSTNRFFTKHSAIQRPSIPFITGDSLLSKMFPRNYSPWHVWIDPEGVVRYITKHSNLTYDTIQRVLNGEAPVLEQLNYKYHL